MSATVSNPWTSNDYTQFCSNVAAFNNCLSQYDCPSTDNKTLYTTYRQMIGYGDAFQYMCTDNARAAYMSNQSCVIDFAQSYSSSCQASEIPANYTSISSEMKCSAQNAFYECVYLGVKENCGETIARMVIEAIQQYTLALQTTDNCTLGIPYTSCTNSSMEFCLETLPSDLRNNMSTPWSTADYNRFCSKVDAYGECTALISCVDGRDSLYKNYQTVVGHADSYKYMCTDEYRNVVPGNFQCLSTWGTASANSCQNSSFPSSNSSSTAVTNQEICRYYTTMFECMYNTVSDKCNEQSGRVFTTFTAIAYKPVLKAYYGCNLDLGKILNAPDGGQGSNSTAAPDSGINSTAALVPSTTSAVVVTACTLVYLFSRL
jgi:hypothetical protein